MRKLLDRKSTAQNGICGICNEKFTDYGNIVPDHISPCGVGGAWRDDHPDNIQVVRSLCAGIFTPSTGATPAGMNRERIATRSRLR